MRVINLIARSLLLGIVSAFALAAQTTNVDPKLNIPLRRYHDHSHHEPDGGGRLLPLHRDTGFSFRYDVGKRRYGKHPLKITSDFTPSAAIRGNSPTAGELLTYGCNASTGTAWFRKPDRERQVSTPVVVFGADAHSPTAGASGTVSWS